MTRYLHKHPTTPKNMPSPRYTPSSGQDVDQLILGQVHRLSRRMLRQFPNVRRWDDTDDVASIASIRVWKSLKEVEVTSDKHFYRIVAQNIRWVLLDLARKHYGPLGWGANHDTGHGEVLSHQFRCHKNLRRWADFHEAIEKLPAEEKEVVDVLWYSGLPRDDAAEVLIISRRTLMNRWRSARLRLYDAMDGSPPEIEHDLRH